MSKNKNFWIIQRHTSSMDLLAEFAKELIIFQGKKITYADKINILKNLIKKGLYKPRNKNLSVSTFDAKINQLCYFMIGYKNNEGNGFVLSPLGKMYLENYKNKNKRNVFFLCLLWNMQYPHPYSKTIHKINIFPFRLIFKLLTDTRLENKLYNYEIFMKIMKIQDISKKEYDTLVNELILDRRNLKYEKLKFNLFQNEETYVNTMYEWDYYTSKLLLFHDLITIKKDSKDKIELFHKKNFNSAWQTKRIFQKKEIKINEKYLNYFKNLLLELPFDNLPEKISSPDSLKIENVRNIYSKIPKIINNTGIGFEVLKLPKMLTLYGNNLNKTSKEFEIIIKKIMNLFYDVEVSRISGPGNTDLECIFKSIENYKFNIEAKSTSKKLQLINSGRLKQHMKKTFAKYTIVITPRYIPAAARDILGENIVLLTSYSLSEFVYRGILSNERNLSFIKINDIILSNLGFDISEKLYQLSFELFGSKF